MPASKEFKEKLMNLDVNSYFGPYKDGEYYKLSKVIEVKQLPDSVKVRHILIPYVGGTRADASITKTQVEAKETADSILAQIRGGAKFMDLLDLSSDKVSNENDGEIEFAFTDSYAPEFRDFSFENKVGDLQVVKTAFGYHIIEILSQGERQKAVKVGNLSLPIEPSEQTIDDVYNKTSKFEISNGHN